MKKQCDVCGRSTNRTYRAYGHILCSKHMHQFHKYGKFLDNIPRTNSDLNDYVVKGSVAIFNVYGQNNVKIGEFIIDREDLEKVKYHKWRFNHGHVVTGSPAKGTQRDLSHVILGVKPNGVNDIVVDHRNGDPLDNRKFNLRVCSQTDNKKSISFMSNNTSGFIGVTYNKKRNLYESEIRTAYIRCRFKRRETLEEAVYQRYIAEQLVFGEVANEGEQSRKHAFTKTLPNERKQELQKHVETKLLEKDLWQ